MNVLSNPPVMKRNFRLICALITWAALIIQYVVMVMDGEHGGFAATTIVYISYFTILTNILAALALTAPFLSSGSKLKAFFERKAVRAAIALYILVVMVVYWAVLAKDHNPEGISAIINVFLHLIVPLLYIFDWLVFTPKDGMSLRRIPWWVAYPMAYGIYTILRGAITGVYPYPFLNVAELGGLPVFLNMLGFTAFYAIGAAAFIGFGRVLPKVTE